MFSLNENDVKVLKEKGIKTPEGILTPIFDDTDKKLNLALDYIDDKIYLTQFIKYLDGQDKKRYPTLICSDKSIITIKDDKVLNDLGFFTEFMPNVIDNRWSNDSMKHFFNGSCPEITIKDAFDMVRNEIVEYIDLPDVRMYDFMACWILGTYFHPMFNSYPYVYLNAMKRSGKTKLLTLVYTMAFNAKFTLSLTPATLFRLVQANRCTLVMDEEEKLTDKDRVDYRSLLLGGYKKGMKVPRAHEGKGKTFQVGEYEVFGPKIMANIGGIEDVLEDRCITLVLLRTMDKNKANCEIDINNEKWQSIRDKLYINLLKNFLEISRCYKLLSDKFSVVSVVSEVSVVSIESSNFFNNSITGSINTKNTTQTTLTSLDKLESIRARDLELWMPILSIGLAVGDNVFDNLVDFALKSINEKEIENATESQDNVLIELLIDVVKEDAYYGTKELLEKFTLHLDIDTKSFDGKWLNAKWLGRAMKRLGFVNKRRVARGVEYKLDQDSIKNIAMRAKVGLDKYVKQKTLGDI